MIKIKLIEKIKFILQNEVLIYYLVYFFNKIKKKDKLRKKEN